MTKRTIIAGLAGLNLFLLAAIVLTADLLPSALAQRLGAAGSYLSVSCKADTDYDALYVLSLADRKLHCFVPKRDRSGKVDYGQSRNLEEDFNRIK